MNVAFIQNKYYSDSGMEYIFSRLKEEFFKCGVNLIKPKIYVNYGFGSAESDFKFAVFWDKDVSLCKMLERQGIRCFNSSFTVENCDDKEKTYACLSDFYKYFSLPKTIVSPLMYDVNYQTDENLFNKIEELNFPVVVKESTGSAGRQVYLAENPEQLRQLNCNLMHIPHIYQQFIKGEKGSDIRVYVIGKKAVAAAKRKNTTSFKSNVSLGGEITLIPLTDKLIFAAEKVASCLNLEYGSADFMEENEQLYFIEANSNAYFRAIETRGINIAKYLAEYILSVCNAVLQGGKNMSNENILEQAISKESILIQNATNVFKLIEDACKSCGRSKNEITVVAATKTIQSEIINLLPQYGVFIAAENRTNEFEEKKDLVKGLTWHFVGALQSNKAKCVTGNVALIHSVDRINLAKEIDKIAYDKGIIQDVLIEVNIGQEPQKSGVLPEDLSQLYDYTKSLNNVKVKGFMTVMPVGASENLYKQMHEIFLNYKKIDTDISILSMGMSDDYVTAIKNGSTCVRLGRCLFGERDIRRTL